MFQPLYGLFVFLIGLNRGGKFRPRFNQVGLGPVVKTAKNKQGDGGASDKPPVHSEFHHLRTSKDGHAFWANSLWP